MPSYNDQNYNNTNHNIIYGVFGIMCDNTDHYCDCLHYYCDGSVVYDVLDSSEYLGLSGSAGFVGLSGGTGSIALSGGLKHNDITYDD